MLGQGRQDHWHSPTRTCAGAAAGGLQAAAAAGLPSCSSPGEAWGARSAAVHTSASPDSSQPRNVSSASSAHSTQGWASSEAGNSMMARKIEMHGIVKMPLWRCQTWPGVHLRACSGTHPPAGCWQAAQPPSALSPQRRRSTLSPQTVAMTGQHQCLKMSLREPR